MLGIKGEEEEQPARRSARSKSVKSSLAKGLIGRPTEEDDGYGNEDHENMVIAQEWQDPSSEVLATIFLEGRLWQEDIRRKLMTNLMLAILMVLRLHRQPH